MMTKLHYFLFIGIFSVLFSCKDKFVLEENTADIEQIITAVIEYDSLNFQKHNKDNIAVAESFKKITIIKEDDDILPVFLGENEISLQTLYSLNETPKSGEAINFDKQDSLYLLSQNEIKDTIKLPQNILKNSNVLTKNRKRTGIIITMFSMNSISLLFPKTKRRLICNLDIIVEKVVATELPMFSIKRKENGKLSSETRLGLSKNINYK